MRAKGGYPEYLFLEKAPRRGQATAEKLAKTVIAGRMIIFAYGEKITDPELGDKGFTGEFFEKQWRAAVDGDMIDATPGQKRIVEKLFWAGRQVIDNNQDRLNVKGVAWKHFLPAKWEREMGQVFTARTGIIIKQPGRTYRSPINVPDEMEREVLRALRRGRPRRQQAPNRLHDHGQAGGVSPHGADPPAARLSVLPRQTQGGARHARISQGRPGGRRRHRPDERDDRSRATDFFHSRSAAMKKQHLSILAAAAALGLAAGQAGSQGTAPDAQRGMETMQKQMGLLTPELAEKAKALPPEIKQFLAKVAMKHDRHSDRLTLVQVMQEMLSDYQTVGAAIATDNREAAADAARRIANHRLPRGGLLPYLPLEMVNAKDLGVLPAMEEAVEGSARRLAAAADKGDLGSAAQELGAMTAGCVACHAHFRGQPGVSPRVKP